MLFDAASCGMQSGDSGVVAEAGRRAAALPPAGDEEEGFLADLVIGVGSLWLETTTENVELMRDVLARADRFPEPRLLAGAAMGAGTLGDERREAELLGRAVALARASGAVDALTLALLAVAVAGVLAGRFDVVPQASEGLALAREAGLTGVASLHLAILAWFAAARGADDECGEHVDTIRRSPTTDNALTNSLAQWALGLLALGSGRPDEAAAALGELANGGVGASHPLVVLVSAADRVEGACVPRRGRTLRARWPS